VLIASTVFALWARFSLGTSWSIAPEVGGDRRLRTEGPYAVTRHPIYTGLLGMILGTALLAGLGQAILAVVAGLIVFSVKVHQEEQLLLATFPESYPGYRQRVPQLIPGLGMLHRRRIHA
jgi:protein-S-isoprenylcysteine O-methyltransferase Ste14